MPHALGNFSLFICSFIRKIMFSHTLILSQEGAWVVRILACNNYVRLSPNGGPNNKQSNLSITVLKIISYVEVVLFRVQNCAFLVASVTKNGVQVTFVSLGMQIIGG